MSLRDRMNRLRGTQPAEQELVNPKDDDAKLNQPPDEGEDEVEDEELSPAWAPMGVVQRSNAHGSYLVREVRYPLDYVHGHHRLSELAIAAPYLSSFHQGEQMTEERLLFLDLETTGLGVGAGNVPFMVGIGYCESTEFIVEQTLIRHPAEERAMLFDLQEKLKDFRYLVTYNGRTFDWPVMQNRFILSGFGRDIWEPMHIDFLHPARSIWRNTLASCRLSHVEEERLGIYRKDDVPGSMAPQLYFQYLAEGNPEPLHGVFLHNGTDMLSLACLAIRFGHLLSGRLGQYIPLPTEPEELVRTGLWLERVGAASIAEPFYEAAAQSTAASAATLMTLASRDKKVGNWQRAVLLWQKAVLQREKYTSSSANEAHIELAMYNEHKLKDYETAYLYAREALERALSHPLLSRRDKKRQAEIDALRNRTQRLERKLGRHTS
ncbi:ribonuclease H-like domain-containing protein [Paenibacillus sp. GCM10023252]|uniref:ribonuclease H-like domain-containing protein n=1 Tax=Paenibacillus sp. GCM10023252 TaxID=3252649 RepID=UPI003613F14E